LLAPRSIATQLVLTMIARASSRAAVRATFEIRPSAGRRLAEMS